MGKILSNFKIIISLLILMIPTYISPHELGRSYDGVIVVPDDYPSIQDAINHANPGDTILVRDGVYKENVKVNKSNLVIKSENGPDVTIVEADNSYEPVFYVTVDNIEIHGFTIRDSYYYSGIKILSNNCTISSNIIKSCWDGIYINPPSTVEASQSNSWIINNVVSNNQSISRVARLFHGYDISIFNFTYNSRYHPADFYYKTNKHLTAGNPGIDLISEIYREDIHHISISIVEYNSPCYNDIIVNNKIVDNHRCGIYLDESDSTYIVNNSISNNWISIFIYCSTNDTIIDNIMANNSIFIQGDSLEEWITHTIENNTVNGKPVYYWKNQAGGIIPEDAGEIILANCHGINIEGQKLKYSSIILAASSDILIANSSIVSNVISIYTTFLSNNITIVNNTLSNTDYGAGIVIDWLSSNNTILDNNISDNYRFGIWLYYSDSNFIRDNMLSNNGLALYLWNSSSNNIENNVVSNNYEGIYLVFSNNDIIMRNIMINNSIFIDGYYFENWVSHIIEKNTVNGKPVYYWKNRDGGTIPYGAGEVILANCHGVKVENQKLENSGILIGFSDHINISDNIISNTPWTGIFLDYSSSNIILNNIISYNNTILINEGITLLNFCNNNIIFNNSILNFWDGIWLYGSSYNVIGNNTILNNTNGLFLEEYSSNNVIENNTLLDNGCGLEGFLRSSRNIITNNVFSNNFIGISLTGFCSRNIISNNSIESSKYYGIDLEIFSNDNRVYHNNFTGNYIHAYFLDSLFNHWKNNYWDDWKGIGPKVIDGEMYIGLYKGFPGEKIFEIDIPWYNFDWYPAKEPYEIG